MRNQRYRQLVLRLWTMTALCLIAITGLDASARLHFHKLTMEQGLSQISINAIVKDDAGFVWLGTQDGLNRYDGYVMTVFKQEPGVVNSLIHSYILSMIKSADGCIWIGTVGGLTRLDPRTGRFTGFENDPDDPDSLVNNRIISLFESPSAPGKIWIGTENGLDCLNSVSGRFCHYRDLLGPADSIRDAIVRTIAESGVEPGIIWVGTDRGMKRLDPVRREVEVFRSISGQRDGLSHDQVHVIQECSVQPGLLLVGTENGLDYFDLRTRSLRQAQFGPDNTNIVLKGKLQVRALHQPALDPETLWIGSYGEGLVRLNRRTGVSQRFASDPADSFGLNDSYVLSFLEDQAGILWIGTEGGGLNYLERHPRGFYSFRHNSDNKNSLSNNLVRAIAESRTDPETLWIGTFGGLSRLDRRSGQYTHFTHSPAEPTSLASNLVRSLCMDHSGVLWVGTQNAGLSRFDPVGNNFFHYRPIPGDDASLSSLYVRVISEDSQGNLWLGTAGGGLCRMSPDRREIRRFLASDEAERGPSSNRIYTVIPDEKRGVIWLGTSQGLNCFNPETERFSYFVQHRADPQSLSNNMVMSLYLDGRGLLWVGTWGGGLNRFNPEDGRFEHFSERDGLSNNVIYGILEDRSGFLWLSTNQGLTRFDPRTRMVHVFDRGDGLQNTEYNANSSFVSAAGEMFFGGLNGLDAFMPEEIRFNTRVPPIRLTGIQLFNKPIGVGESVNGRVLLPRPIEEMSEIVLSHQEKVIAFEYTSLNFIQAAKNRFAYRMNGLEAEWNHVGQRRFASYTTLPSGTYTFQVRVANNDGVWNETGASLRVIVQPPFWLTWWFMVLLGAGVLGLITLVFSWRVRKITQRKRELEETVRERTQKLSQANRQLELVNDELKKLSIVASETDNAVLIMDAGANIEWVNEGFIRMYGSLDELISRRGSNMLIASENREIHDHYRRCIEERRSIVYETLSHALDPAGIWMQTTLTPIIDAQGGVSRLIAIETDVNSIKTAEEQIRRQKEQLKESNDKMVALNQELLRLASHDGLTGIANHRCFVEFIEQEWRRALRYGRPISLIMADVDLFKSCNDEFGHQAGDHCLRMIARILNDLVKRPTDLVARYGGEEFAVVLSETALQGVLYLAERIRSEVEENVELSDDERRRRVTISLGCASLIPSQDMDLNQLIRAADQALYHSKENGRNRISFTEQLNPSVIHSL